MKIIKEDDPRYSLLPDLWSKWNWDNIIKEYGHYSIYCFIPKELVVTPVYRKTFSVTNKVDAIVYKREFPKVILRATRLTSQEYFDLMVLHINNTNDRPRCPVCGNEIYYYSPLYGYGSPYLRWKDKPANIFCCHSCEDKYRWNDENDTYNTEEFRLKLSNSIKLAWSSGILSKDNLFNLSSLWEGPDRAKRIKEYSDRMKDPKNHAWLSYNHFIKLGNINDKCYLYLVNLGTQYKFGVTNNINTRSITLSCELRRKDQLELIPIFEGTRLEVANLEASIKLLRNSHEYFDLIEKEEVLQLINNIINRGITNPFEL